MFSTKKDIDRHVKTSLNKLPENERYMRGLAIARQYFKLNEFASAEHWLSCFLSVQEDSAPAHKLLGQCYEKQRKFDRAITSYQRSLQLDSKQTGLITDVCKLLLMDENLSKNLSKAKHWCELAESERINHEAVLNLKLKVANKDTTTDKKLVKDIILKEIIARPLDPTLRVRLVDQFLEEKKLDEAFKYCFELEMKFSEAFLQSIEWTNGVANMLAKYTEQLTAGQQQKHWNYYLLLAIVLDRQIYLNLLADSTMETIKRSNMKEVAHKLYELDQTLRQVAEKGRNAAPQKQMAEQYLRHYRGQLLLYSATLLFKGTAQDQSGTGGGGRSRDTTRKCLALLLLAYQCGVPDPDELWLKQSSESARQVVAFWSKQAAFRCCQAGSTVLSCVEETVDVSVLAQIQIVTETKIWTTADDLINQVRQLCADPGWRKHVFRSLYPSGDPSAKASSASYFVQDGVAFAEPQYVLPKREQLNLYLELAQSLYPSSLPYLVYLGLVVGVDNLAEFRCKAFPRLNFSTNNLDNCNLETLNQLDMDSFLYCSVLVAQSNLDGARHHLLHYQQQQQPHQNLQGRPPLLPAANLIPLLCEDNKVEWWSTAYHLIRSSTAKDAAASVAEQKQLLQHGLQAIRGTGAPLCDVIVLLKLGQILATRASGSTLITAEERRYVECRAEAVYKAAVLLWKIRAESSSLGPSSYAGASGSAAAGGVFFKYGLESYDCQQETVKLAEAAITFLAGVYFKHGRYEEFTHDFGGIPLPFAAYFRSEAYRKLDESNKTPLKAKKFYSERARECIRQTQRYLELPYIERNHPLNFVVQNELKRQSTFNDSLDSSLNTSSNGGPAAGGGGSGGGGAGDDSDQFQSFTSSITNAAAASMMMLPGAGTASGLSDRDTATAAATAAATVCLSKTNELESLIRQMMETLTFVKEDVLGIRNDVGDMQDRLVKIEENIYRQPAEKGGATAGQEDPPATGTSASAASAASAAAAAAAVQQAMNDMYLMDEYQSSAAVAAAAAAYHQAAVGRLPPTPQQAAAGYHHHQAIYGAYNYLPHQQAQMLTPRGHSLSAAVTQPPPPPPAMVASPMHHHQGHAYQHSMVADSLLVAAPAAPAAPGSGYHHPTYQQIAPPPPVAPQTTITNNNSSTPIQQKLQGGGGGGTGGLSLEQSLQTPALLSSWNSTYNTTPIGVQPTVAQQPEVKGGAPVNVVITSSDPLPPPPSANSSTFASGTSIVQPTYSVTIPPQHIKHSNTSAQGGSIGQGTTHGQLLSTSSSSISNKVAVPVEAISPAAPPAAVLAVKPLPAASVASPSFFANLVASTPAASKLSDGTGGPGGNGDDDDDDDDARNVSGSAEYDPRPDFKPIIPLPDEIVVRTGEEDEEQMFSGRSKLLRLVEREWKERGLGELKILRSKADPSQYRIVMRREQVHKICANHYITPELIIKPMEKRPECYIWAAMDFADEEPRKESFCARFGTADLAKQFYAAFVAARTEVARLREAGGTTASSTTPGAVAGQQAAKPPPSTTGGFSFSSTPKSASGTTPSAAKPFGEFTFAKNYTPPVAKADTTTQSQSQQQGDGKPSPFASFTFKAAQTPAAATPAAGFGDLFKPKSGSWDCGACYVNNKADATRCLVCDGPRDPSKKDDNASAAPTVKPKPALFGNLAPPTEGGMKFTFGMPATAGTTVAGAPAAATTNSAAPGFGGALSLGKKEQISAKPPPATSTPTNAGQGAAAGFGDKFKPKPGAWTCNGCYLSNGADTLYCISCETPKDDTVPKKSSTGGAEATGASGAGGGGSVASLLKAADTMPKFNFTAGGGFTFGAAPAAATGTTASTAVTPASTTTSVVSSVQQQPAFGGGFTFGSPLKPTATTNATASQQPTAPANAPGAGAKPVFKFELPTPAGGLSFGSKLTSASGAGTGVAQTTTVSKLDPPEKATFEFVFKPKSPGRTLSGGSTGAEGTGSGAAGGAADDDGGAGDNSVTEEENNTYFAPVIPLPDKVDVKTGEEDEHVLYAHRAKLYRFVSSEWKERGIGDVKILKHRETDKLRVVMRREQVLKICLNHALTEDVCYSKKDDKSWQFVANDFSEGAFELMNFCLRFKSADIAQDFRDAVSDALSGKLTGVQATTTATKQQSPALHDSTLTSLSSPGAGAGGGGGGDGGELSFSKLSDISLNERETAQKLKLPENFFDSPAVTCAGCPGCDPDAYVFPKVVDHSALPEADDDAPLPIDIKDVKPLPPIPAAVASASIVPKKVTFGGPGALSSSGAILAAEGAATATAGGGLFAGFASKPTAGVTSSFLSSEQKLSSSPFLSTTPMGSVFGGTTTGGAQDQNNKLIFGSSPAVGSSSSASGGSIFSASLNTTPKTSFGASSATPAGTAPVGAGDKLAEQATSQTPPTVSSSTNSAAAPTVTSLLQQATPLAGGNIFSSYTSGFGSGGNSTPNIFGGGATTTNLFTTPSVLPSSGSSTPTTTTPSTGLFGSVGGFGDPAASKPTSVFGGSGSGFTFAGLAKQATVPATEGTAAAAAGPLFTMDESLSFATIANSNPAAFSGFMKTDNNTTPTGGGGTNANSTPGSTGGFVGLTVKDDFFSRSAKLNSSADGNNGNADESSTGGEAAGGDENYDPYYAPVIQLPDEIEVRTGEEEETKLFGDRAKLYRYDSDTKEWKERGVGEVKILHHPVRKAYRLLLRREHIHKLVLNHAITADLAVTAMNHSRKAFVWGAMNHAEAPPQLEKLAVRFKNETIGDLFRATLEQCQESLRSRPDLEPDQD